MTHEKGTKTNHVFFKKKTTIIIPRKLSPVFYTSTN